MRLNRIDFGVSSSAIDAKEVYLKSQKYLGLIPFDLMGLNSFISLVTEELIKGIQGKLIISFYYLFGKIQWVSLFWPFDMSALDFKTRMNVQLCPLCVQRISQIHLWRDTC